MKRDGRSTKGMSDEEFARYFRTGSPNQFRGAAAEYVVDEAEGLGDLFRHVGDPVFAHMCEVVKVAHTMRKLPDINVDGTKLDVSKRQSGRSTWQLDICVRLANYGVKVDYVINSMTHADYYHDLMVKHFSLRGPKMPPGGARGLGTWHSDAGGEIRFRAWKPRKGHLRGGRLVVEDHHVIEERAR